MPHPRPAPAGSGHAEPRARRRPALAPLARLARLACTLALSLPLWPAAHAEERSFPPAARKGVLTPGYFPEVEIDGRLRRLAPAGRIFNQDNLSETPAALRGRQLAIAYTEDRDGQIARIWLLNREEAARPLKLDAPAPR